MPGLRSSKVDIAQLCDRWLDDAGSEDCTNGGLGISDEICDVACGGLLLCLVSQATYLCDTSFAAVTRKFGI